MSDNLQQAIALIKSGKRQDGQQLLLQILKNDPNNEQAWLWMSVVVSGDKRRSCLEKVLSINPNNQQAKQALAMLAKVEVKSSPPLSPAPAKSAMTSESVTRPSISKLENSVEYQNHTKTLDQLSPEGREKLQGVMELIAYELLVNRRSQEEIIERLVARGFPQADVRQFVGEVAPNILAQDKMNRRKRYKSMMVGGCATMLVGIGVTALFFVFSIGLGGTTFVVFSGAIVGGLIAFIIGFISWFSNLF